MSKNTTPESAEDQPRRKSVGRNVFALTDLYPDLEAVFSFRLKPVAEVKDSCVVVVDTNVLLLPYTVNPKSLEAIRNTYAKLIADSRLIIPGQAVREFAKNRASKITDLYKQLSDMRSVRFAKLDNYPLLQSLSEFNAALELAAEIEKLQKRFREKLSELLETIKNWTWNDPVSEVYKDLFNSDVLLDLNFTEESRRDLETSLDYRNLHKIPPGYKDGAKGDNSVGDLIIWNTILAIGREKKNDVIFVSVDEKSDWWHRSDSQLLYPRFELIDEFRRVSEGCSFHIIPFSHLLELFGVSEDVVTEVRGEEILDNGPYPPFINLSTITRAVLNWFKENVGQVRPEWDQARYFDFLVTTGLHRWYGVEIKCFEAARDAAERFDQLSAELTSKNQGAGLDGCMIAFVGENESDASEVCKILSSSTSNIIPALVGHICEGKFKLIKVFGASVLWEDAYAWRDFGD